MKTILEPIKYILYDIGINIKCKMKILNEEFRFNCGTRYEEVVEEQISRLILKALTSEKTFKEILIDENIIIYEMM